MKLLLSLFFLFQAGTLNDIAELRQLLGLNYRSALQVLDAKNQILLRNTERLAPQQAAEMRARWTPPALPAGDRPAIVLTLSNLGQGLVTFLFEEDFITERVDLVFCPAQPASNGQPAKPERLMALQVLFDDSRAVADTVGIFQRVYQLPAPVPAAAYQPALKYPLPGVTYDDQGMWKIDPTAPPIILWDLGTAEALYSPVNQPLITGQLWLADKAIAKACPQPTR